MRTSRKLQKNVSGPFSHKANKGSPGAATSDSPKTLKLGYWNSPSYQAKNPDEARPKNASPKKSPQKASPKSKSSPQKAMKKPSKKASPKKNRKMEEQESSDSEGTLVEAASSESDLEISLDERLRQRKAKLYVEWVDYKDWNSSFRCGFESLEKFTKNGLLNAGWNLVDGQWSKPISKTDKKKKSAKKNKSHVPKKYIIMSRPKTGSASSSSPSKSKSPASSKKGKMAGKAAMKVMKVRKDKLKRS